MPFLLLYFKFIFKGNSYKKIISCRFNYHFSQLFRTSFTETLKQPPQPKSTKHDESFLLRLSKLKKIFYDTYIFIWYPSWSELATGNLHL